MIEVIIRHVGSEAELGRIEIENVDTDDGGNTATYSIRFGVEKITGVGIHQRPIFNFPRKRYNVLALLLQALNTLEERDLELGAGWEYRTPVEKIKKLRRHGWFS